jgi:hypothetical protein
MSDDLIDSGIHLLTLLDATREESRMVNYVAKGRLYQSLSEIQLEEKYEKTVKLFSEDVLNRVIRETYDDFCCEYSIRNITPPDKKIWCYWKKIIEAAKGIIESMSDEDKERINREMIEDARAVAGRKS